MSALKAYKAQKYRPQAELTAMAHRLQEWRMVKGMSRRELGRRAGLSTSAITRLERSVNDPRYGTLVCVAKGLGITVHQLLVHDPLTSGYLDDL